MGLVAKYKTDSKKVPRAPKPEGPTVHVTADGTQYARVIDIVRSEAGRKEIRRLREADLLGRKQD